MIEIHRGSEAMRQICGRKSHKNKATQYTKQKEFQLAASLDSNSIAFEKT